MPLNPLDGRGFGLVSFHFAHPSVDIKTQFIQLFQRTFHKASQFGCSNSDFLFTSKQCWVRQVADKRVESDSWCKRCESAMDIPGSSVFQRNLLAKYTVKWDWTTAGVVLFYSNRKEETGIYDYMILYWHILTITYYKNVFISSTYSIARSSLFALHRSGVDCSTLPAAKRLMGLPVETRRCSKRLHGNSYTGWWFGTCFIFPYIGNSHPNWLSYFSEGFKPPTNTIFKHIQTTSTLHHLEKCGILIAFGETTCQFSWLLWGSQYTLRSVRRGTGVNSWG